MISVQHVLSATHSVYQLLKGRCYYILEASSDHYHYHHITHPPNLNFPQKDLSKLIRMQNSKLEKHKQLTCDSQLESNPGYLRGRRSALTIAGHPCSLMFLTLFI